jgi:outer membrane protein W
MEKCKVVGLFLVVCFFVFSNSAMAGQVGTSIPIAEKQGIGLSVGAEGNFVLDRDLEKTGALTSGKIEESNQVSANVNFQPTKFFNGYLKLGTGNLEEKFNWDVSRSQTIKFDYGLLSAGGANLMYDFGNNFGAGWDNQITWWHAEVDSVSGDHSPTVTSKGSVNNYDYQSTLYVKYTINTGDDNLLTPYVGACYSYFKSKIDKEIKIQDDTYIYTYGDIENDDKIGVVVGLNGNLGKSILLNLEGRFISETAVTINASYKF